MSFFKKKTLVGAHLLNVVTPPAPTNVLPHSCIEKKNVTLSFLSECWIHVWFSESSYMWGELERKSSGGII